LVKERADLSGFSSAAMAIAMLAAFLLVIGGIKLMRAPGSRGKGVLMLIAAIVLIGNVAILTI
jgi:hypothetical protein